MKIIYTTIHSRFGRDIAEENILLSSKLAMSIFMIYNSWQVAIKYFKYYLAASNGKGHGMHSPFVYDFIRNVLNDKQQFPEYEVVEKLRLQLLERKEEVEVEDFGAGSGISNSKKRVVASIARHAVKSKKYSQLLFRIVRKYRPEQVIELGTSLGVSTSYFSLANPSASIITIEGSPAIAKIAKQNFDQLGFNNIKLLVGNFDTVLPTILNEKSEIQFAFIDGNHQYESTVQYFKALLPAIQNDSVVILDDIHWSSGMEKAWEEIGKHKQVKCTIDLFFFGLVFFREEFREKQHFRIRF